jgi:hypothetical protein
MLVAVVQVAHDDPDLLVAGADVSENFQIGDGGSLERGLFKHVGMVVVDAARMDAEAVDLGRRLGHQHLLGLPERARCGKDSCAGAVRDRATALFVDRF